VSRRWALTAAAATGALLPLLALPSAALAAEGGAALVSLDGTSYSAAPDGAIFDSGLVLIPGSSATGTFFVKNDSDRAADLTIAVANTSATSGTIIQHLTMQASTPSMPAQQPVQLEPGSTCTPLLSGQTLDARSVTKVTITLSMAEAVGNADQGSTADTDLRVSLTDPDAPSAADCEAGGIIPVVEKPNADPRPGTPGIQRGEQIPALAPLPDTEKAAPALSPTDLPAVAAPPTAGSNLLQPAAPLPFALMAVAALVVGAGTYLIGRRRAA
jgi:hypothetical protein